MTEARDHEADEQYEARGDRDDHDDDVAMRAASEPGVPDRGAVLAALDAALGPAAVLSLTARDLVPDPGRGAAVRRPDDDRELGARVLGALMGVELGWTLGAPHEWGRAVAPASLRWPRGVRPGAEVVMLRWSVEALLDDDLGAAPALADRLRGAPRLAQAGNALPATIAALRRGTPWFEAGVGSFGAGAAVRAVAAGCVLQDRPAWRPVLAGLDAAVTHASVEAVAVSGAVAELVAALLAYEPGDDPLALLDEARAACGDGPAAATIELARHRLAHDGPPRPSGPTATDALGAAIGHAFAHLDDPEVALRTAVAAGGDTDTVAALTGAFVGAANGAVGLPVPWVAQIDRVQWEALSARIVGGALQVPGPSDWSDRCGDATGALHVHLLLDRSGSMAAIRSDVVGGVNALLAQHQAADGPPCRFTIVQFDAQDPFEALVDDRDVRDVRPIDPRRYEPRGATPLYDAIGMLLDHAERRTYRRVRRGQDPGDQLVVIVTDGLENASRRWTRAEVFRRISELTDDGWAFAFLGANQDAYAEGAGLGIAAPNVSGWTSDHVGTGVALASLGRASMSYREKTRRARRAQRHDFFEGVKEAER